MAALTRMLPSACVVLVVLMTPVVLAVLEVVPAPEPVAIVTLVPVDSKPLNNEALTTESPAVFAVVEVLISTFVGSSSQ